MAKERLDVLVTSLGLAESREQAQRVIMAGQVLVDGHPATKPGHRFATDATVLLRGGPRFVSRGGDKLDAALEAFDVGVRGRVCLDVGASTGGFTDCLLQRGAARVIAVDVGKGQLHWRLRNDPRVVVLEGVNARYLTPEQLPATPTLAVIDVAFISLTKILPAVKAVLQGGAQIVSLVKPQFEAGREQVGKGGVVRDAGVREQVILKIRAYGTEELGLAWRGTIESPLRGPAGNVEFLMLWETA